MTLRQLIEQHEFDDEWNGQVFICYSTDMILRKSALEGRHVADGERFLVKDLDKDILDRELKFGQWWFEDNDLCVDFNRER